MAKVSGRIPKLIRLAMWIRANDFAMTAFTPMCFGANAACSREEPCP